MIIRPEQKAEEHLDAWPGQTDFRYAEGPLRESEPVPENAVPHRRAASQKCCGDDYASRPVARCARAMECRLASGSEAGVYTMDKCSWNEGRACCARAESQPTCESGDYRRSRWPPVPAASNESR